MKKKIKIKYVGFWGGLNENDNYFTNILKKKYEVEISDDPDYLFCSVLGEPYEECNYDCIRIHFNGENYTPDFNIHDYGISFNNLDFGDRHLEYPIYLINESLLAAQKKHLNIDGDILEQKSYFCNFIYGVSRDYRNEAFEKFSTYKKVMSPGSGKNNMPDHALVTSQEDKLNFQRKTKFTIAFDSTQHLGFVTEKLLHGFASQTIPIYFGAPDVGKYFNKKSFIDVADYDYDLDLVLERIIEIDNDDNLFLTILREPAFANDNYVAKKENEIENFLKNIFEQDIDKAYRRSKIAAPQNHTLRLRQLNSLLKSRFFNLSKIFFR